MIVDSEPIRSAARRDHEAVRTRMEAMERQIESFERQELPAYQRWVHLNFGPQLTELRETELTAASKEAILERIEYYQIWGNMSPVHAYAKVKSELENPDSDAEVSSTDPYETNTDFGGCIDEDEDLYNIYEAVKDEFEKETGFEAPDFDSFKYAIGLGSKQKGEVDNKADSRNARIKKLYRKIARFLHPDFCGQFSLREQRLWNRAQEAYKARDVISLETVLSHLEAASSGPLFALSVSDILENTKEMRSRVDYLEEDLKQARRHPAWRFTQKTEKQLKSLRKSVENEIVRTLQESRENLAFVDATLRELESAHNRRASRKRRSRRWKGTAPMPKQASFQF